MCDHIVVAVGDGKHEVAYRRELREFEGRVGFVRDSFAGSGPLAGLHAALGAVPEGYAFVMACDMPHVSETLARRMLDRLGGHDPAAGEAAGGSHAPGGDTSGFGESDYQALDGDATAGEVLDSDAANGLASSGDAADGRAPDVIRSAEQPFHAMYHTRAAAHIEMMLMQGDFRVMGLLKRLSARLVEPITEQERLAFSNLNTPEAYERFLRNEACDPEG